jgi:hypothetical protein
VDRARGHTGFVGEIVLGPPQRLSAARIRFASQARLWARDSW